MITAVVIIGLVALAAGFWFYVRTNAGKDVEIEQAKALAKEAELRRAAEEANAKAEAEARDKEFNEKAAAVTDAAGAVELLKDVTGRPAH